MFDFDVVTGPGNTALPAKPTAATAGPKLTSPPQAAPAEKRESPSEPSRPAPDSAAARP